jgi:hypothetical protein
LIIPSVFSNVYLQFLWIVHFLLSLRYSLTYICSVSTICLVIYYLYYIVVICYFLSLSTGCLYFAYFCPVKCSSIGRIFIYSFLDWLLIIAWTVCYLLHISWTVSYLLHISWTVIYLLHIHWTVIYLLHIPWTVSYLLHISWTVIYLLHIHWTVIYLLHISWTVSYLLHISWIGSMLFNYWLNVNLFIYGFFNLIWLIIVRLLFTVNFELFSITRYIFESAINCPNIAGI